MVSDQQKLDWNPEILKSQPEYGKMKRKCFNLTENLKCLIYNEFHIMQQNNNEYYFPLLSILFLLWLLHELNMIASRQWFWDIVHYPGVQVYI